MIHSKNKIIIATVIVLLIVGVIIFIKQQVGPISIPKQDETVTEQEKENTLTPKTDTKAPIVAGITVPDGFEIRLFADKVKGARTIQFDSNGRIIVAQTSQGSIVSLQDKDGDGVAETRKVIAENLDKPHGMTFDCPIDDRNLPCYLYLAQRAELGRFLYDAENSALVNYEKLAVLGSSRTDRHFTRSLLFLPSPNEHILLVSVGSSCDVCNEKDPMHAKIMAYDTKTKTLSEYASGLRNATFLEINPVDGKIFATEMGRDGLGDNTPPDEINIIEQGKNYGWPICYGKNTHDTSFDKNVYIQNPCADKVASFIDLPAHSAPLGLAFIPEEGWPEDYWYDIVVAFHGSWNRSEPTGYKITRLKMDAQGKYEGMEDFASGWLTTKGTKLGRPVDIKVQPGGTVYISDDSRGAIYRVTHK